MFDQVLVEVNRKSAATKEIRNHARRLQRLSDGYYDLDARYIIDVNYHGTFISVRDDDLVTFGLPSRWRDDRCIMSVYVDPAETSHLRISIGAHGFVYYGGGVHCVRRYTDIAVSLADTTLRCNIGIWRLK